MSDLVPSSYAALPHMPKVLHQDKFVEAARLFGYRVLHAPYEPCPSGSQGCVLCKGDKIGFHRRPVGQVDVVDTLRYGRADGLTERLSHRFRLTPLVLVAEINRVAVTLAEGVDFRIATGREVQWIGARRPDHQSLYTVSYRAYEESWVHLQHAYGDFGGLKRQSERDRVDRLGIIPQGGILMSINHDNPGYDLMLGDAFVAVDGSEKVAAHIVAGRANNRSLHRYVHEVERAYFIDEDARLEVPVSVSFNRATLNFDILDDLEDDTRVAVVYRAAPQYSVWMDGGEFRNPLGQNHQRLVILVKSETNI